MDQKLTAYRCLKRGGLLSIDMLEGIRRGVLEIIEAGGDGVLAADGESGQYSLSAFTPEESRRLTALALERGARLFCVHQRHTVDALAASFDFPFYLECVQAVYLSKEPPREPSPCGFRALAPDMAEWVCRNYHNDSGDLGYISQLLEKGVFTGAYVGDRCAGFIGRHSDGSIGLLDVLPEIRRLGIGAALERKAIGDELELGNVPFGQVVWDNHASLALQRAVGMTVSDGHLWWLELREKK